ncbi:MAG: exopolysaccharide biosynthesis protein [Gammaproteobacteria bacterium]|nr:exopolysaccharide biosynthesis protein [Gammaproteobacteria bacterium]
MIRTSVALSSAATDMEGRISIGEIVNRLGDRVYGMLMIFLALPNLIPVPGIPGVSTVFGILMLLVSVQMAAGLSHPWIPEQARRLTFPCESYRHFVNRIGPYLQRVERLLKPRWPLLVSPLAERGLGLIFVVLSLAVALPIPFVNWVPCAIITLGSLGLIERDGVFVSLSAGTGLFLLVFVTDLVMTALETILEPAWPLP